MKKEDKVLMSCFDPAEEGTIKRIKEKSIIISVGKNLYEVPNEFIIKGEKYLKVIDFDKVVELEGLPDAITESISANVEDIDSIKSYDIGNANITGFKIEGEKNKDARAIEKHIVDEFKPFAEMVSKGETFSMVLSKDGHFGIIELLIPVHIHLESLCKMHHKEDLKEILYCRIMDNELMSDSCAVSDGKMFYKIYYMIDGKWWFGVSAIKEENGVYHASEIDWANENWTERMEHDIIRVGGMQKKIKVGNAYGGRIAIDNYTETSDGYFYEGSINKEKLSTKLKDFLDSNNLDVNDRESVIQFLQNKGMDIKITKNPDGFVSARARSLVIHGRRSMTRAYIEVLEKITE